MNPLAILYCRVYQQTLNFFSHFLSFKEPEVLSGEGKCAEIPSLLKKKGFMRPLIITDPGVYSLGLCQLLEDSLKSANISYEVYSKVIPNPTFDCILEAEALAKKSNCDSLIALGGGSSIDTAKAVGALLANPRASLLSLKGVLKVHRRYALLIAVPTTAGTGSETTVAAVVVNPKTHEKFAINDPKLIPQVAVLDSSLLSKLPPKIIAATGMDALTHAIEAYIGHERTKKTKRYSIEAIRLIDENLYAFYQDPANQKARSSMQRASYLAGVSFTRSYVGYAHAIAHALGGEYNIPHGLANAVILPHVLRAYGVKAEKNLARLAEAIGVGKANAPIHERALAFIDWIEGMNEKMGIPKTFDHVIKPEDIPILSSRSEKEANPLYPVPKEFSRKELEAIYKEIDPQ